MYKLRNKKREKLEIEKKNVLVGTSLKKETRTIVDRHVHELFYHYNDPFSPTVGLNNEQIK